MEKQPDFQPDEVFKTLEEVYKEPLSTSTVQAGLEMLRRNNAILREMRHTAKVKGDKEITLFQPYTFDQALFVINALRNTVIRYKEKFRDSGKNYARHPIGAAEKLATHQHRVDHVTQAAALAHDDLEEVEKMTKELVCQVNHLIPYLRNTTAEAWLADARRVGNIAEGVTKVENQKERRKKNENTLGKIFTWTINEDALGNKIEGDEETAYVKVADRSDNMSDVDQMKDKPSGDKKEVRQKGVADNTAESIIPITLYFHLNPARDYLVEQCARFSTPELLRQYQQLVLEKRKQLIEPFRDKIWGQFTDFFKRVFGSGQISLPEDDFLYSSQILTDAHCPFCFEIPQIQSVRFVPRSLGEALNNVRMLRSEIPLSEISLSDLDIQDEDSMHEILVLVNKPDHISKAFGYIISQFGYGPMPNQQNMNIGFNRGIRAQIGNENLGGTLVFRINDVVSEALSYRGIDPIHGSRAEFVELRDGIRNTLAQVGPTFEGIFFAARKEIFKPRINVFTLKERPMQLPEGATGLDFARIIDTEIFHGAQYSVIKDHTTGKKTIQSLFKPLKDQERVFIQSCLSEKAPHDRTKIQIGPHWQHFCQAHAKNSLSKILHGTSPRAMRQMANKYLKELSNLFGIEHLTGVKELSQDTPKWLKQLADEGDGAKVLFKLAQESLKTGSEEVDEKETIKKIACAEVDFVKLLARQEPFKSCTVWKVRVLLEDQPGTLNRFVQLLQENEKINLLHPGQRTGKIVGDKVEVVATFNFDPFNLSPEEFLQSLLYAKYHGYDAGNGEFKPYECSVEPFSIEQLDEGSKKTIHLLPTHLPPTLLPDEKSTQSTDALQADEKSESFEPC